MHPFEKGNWKQNVMNARDNSFHVFHKTDYEIIFHLLHTRNPQIYMCVFECVHLSSVLSIRTILSYDEMNRKLGMKVLIKEMDWKVLLPLVRWLAYYIFSFFFPFFLQIPMIFFDSFSYPSLFFLCHISSLFSLLPICFLLFF